MDDYSSPDFEDNALYDYCEENEVSEKEWEVHPTMEEQEEIQAKIDAYNQIDEDIKNQKKPF